MNKKIPIVAFTLCATCFWLAATQANSSDSGKKDPSAKTSYRDQDVVGFMRLINNPERYEGHTVICYGYLGHGLGGGGGFFLANSSEKSLSAFLGDDCIILQNSKLTTDIALEEKLLGQFVLVQGKFRQQDYMRGFDALFEITDVKISFARQQLVGMVEDK